MDETPTVDNLLRGDFLPYMKQTTQKQEFDEALRKLNGVDKIINKYAGLNITRDVLDTILKEMKTLYHITSRKKHPDKGGSQKQFSDINYAYILLKTYVQSVKEKYLKLKSDHLP